VLFLDYSAVKSIGIIGTTDAATLLGKTDVEFAGCVMKMWRDLNGIRIRTNSRPFCTLCNEQHRIGLLTGNTVFPALDDETDEIKKISG